MKSMLTRVNSTPLGTPAQLIAVSSDLYLSDHVVFTATCFSNVAVMGSLDVRPSVRPSVTLVIPDHIRRARWNFITRLISPMSSLAARKISAI